MKLLITAVSILFCSISIQAQNIFDTNKSKENRQQELLNFIKSDIDLYSHYKSGQKNLSVAKKLGIASLVFLGADVLIFFGASDTNNIGNLILLVALLAISSVASAITGTIGTILHFKGKGKKKDVMNYAKQEVGKKYGMELQPTNNGFGLVLNF